MAEMTGIAVRLNAECVHLGKPVRECSACLEVAFMAYGLEQYRAGLGRAAAHFDAIEERSAEAHEVYQIEAHRRGDVRHPDAYAELSEATKEWDRVLVRWVAQSIRRLRSGQVGSGPLPEHVDTERCWCGPELNYTAQNGNQVWVHRDRQ